MKGSSIRSEVVHWLTIGSGILAGILEMAKFVNWIPGRYGHLSCALFAFVGIVYAIILKVEKRLASPEELVSAIGDSFKDVSPDVAKAEDAATKLIKAAEEFAPKGK